MENRILKDLKNGKYIIEKNGYTAEVSLQEACKISGNLQEFTDADNVILAMGEYLQFRQSETPNLNKTSKPL
jgi:hypothetical protein